jgi:hypothetical protein
MAQVATEVGLSFSEIVDFSEDNYGIEDKIILKRGGLS